MAQHMWRGALRTLAGLVTLGALAAAPAAAQGTCPGNPDALGTARVMEVDTNGGFEIGTKIYKGKRLAGLQPREIVLTFDDGPFGKTTDDILAALARECVRATFFVVGRMAVERPGQLKRIEAQGHTVAHHTMTHPILRDIPLERAKADMIAGWQAVDRILYGTAGASPRVPFFRFPGFGQSRDLTRWLWAQDIGVFGADFWGSDWNKMSAEALTRQVLTRAEEANGGVMLLHDIHVHTAAAVPAILRGFKARGFTMVHIVPKGTLAPVATGSVRPTPTPTPAPLPTAARAPASVPAGAPLDLLRP